MMNWDELINQAKKDISLIKDSKDSENWRIKYLGRKSDLSLFFNTISHLSLEQRKKAGKKANSIRQILKGLYEEQKKNLNSFPAIKLDITRPGERIYHGHLHPLTLITKKITSSFERMGFEIVEGPEIETEHYNFDALNIPADHPARDMWDTLWLKSKTKNKYLLRTHTSPEQIHYMEMHQPPFRIIAPGRCFRHEATDSSHEVQFHQIEGLMVGDTINMANFKAIIELVIREIFSNDIDVRFRPSYFPFVTSGVEVDIKLKSAKDPLLQGWLEVMGAGMVHPYLFSEVGYNPDQWQGFAFGLGIERIAMIKYRIDDIRLFFNSDIRFLEQF